MTKQLTEPIKEIFTSIQGEGPYVGVRQVFVRFCGCNLSCAYCDTDYSAKKVKKMRTDAVAEKINIMKNVHSIAITGGEPLLHADFLLELFPKLKAPIYLETNATLSKELAKVIDYVKIISADIKLPSASGVDQFQEHEKFIRLCKKHDKEVFAKVVFDKNIRDGEIYKTIDIASRYDLPLVLQPMMKCDEMVTDAEFNEDIFCKFIRLYPNVRLIPQTHKFLGLK